MATLKRLENQTSITGSEIQVIEWSSNGDIKQIHTRIVPFVGSSIRLKHLTSSTPTGNLSFVTEKIEEILVETKKGDSYYCKFKTEDNNTYELTV